MSIPLALSTTTLGWKYTACPADAPAATVLDGCQVRPWLAERASSTFEVMPLPLGATYAT